MPLHSRNCSFDLEVSIANLFDPPRYAAFLAAVRNKRRLYTIRENGVWTTLRNSDGRGVVPFWLSLEGAKECVAREWPGLAVAPVAISRVVDEWTGGWLPRDVWIGAGIESATEGVLVSQHRFWVNLFEDVDYLPYYRPHRGKPRP